MSNSATALPDLAAIRAAQRRIAPYVHRTPVLHSRSLDALAAAELYFKCENFQKAGAFKARCGELTDAVHDTREDLTITQQGDEIARLAPAVPRRRAGALRHLLVGMGDVLDTSAYGHNGLEEEGTERRGGMEGSVHFHIGDDDLVAFDGSDDWDPGL